ncbi:hypothetical protein NIE88_20175 [Sporolactobacillus shoreicorticis]|uniref:Uncharacterized protein n=1 Tax=Sporolactobacillus shoreicorticis TaxID=1923877 RepID=A0ABW5S640_9BACL|nr:hypothetical protein [Sporolactobacillus shoreicorticis]MCO7128064.1 hypothetical protein [Sporolactobacillus shoreicorticis]
MSFFRKYSISLVSLLLIVSMLYIPMMIHPPVSSQITKNEERPLIASEKLDRDSAFNNSQMIVRSERKNFVYEPILK